jgi:hypothetical protein
MPVIIDEVLTEFRIEPTTKTKRLFSKLLAEDGDCCYYTKTN